MVPVAAGPRNPKKSTLRSTDPTGMRSDACIELPLSLYTDGGSAYFVPWLDPVPMAWKSA